MNGNRSKSGCGLPSTGILAKTRRLEVAVPYFRRAVVDFTAGQPGLSLFHCHIQRHADYGFKAPFR